MSRRFPARYILQYTLFNQANVVPLILSPAERDRMPGGPARDGLSAALLTAGMTHAPISQAVGSHET